MFWAQLYKKWGYVTIFKAAVKYSYFGLFGVTVTLLVPAFMKGTNLGVWVFGMVGWITSARTFWGLRPQVLEYIELSEEYGHDEDEEDY